MPCIFAIADIKHTVWINEYCSVCAHFTYSILCIKYCSVFQIIKDVLTDYSGSTSFLHMVHPDDRIRLAAVKGFAEKVSTGQVNVANFLVFVE